MVYRTLFRLLLARLDPERAHALGAGLLRVAVAVPGVTALLRRLLAPRDPTLRVRAFGRELASPLGVAAGVDKGATWVTGLGALGFGCVEVGTVTAQPQPGNPRPRVLRLIRDRALLNRMGFPSPGAAAVADRLARARSAVPVGVNIGRSKDTPANEAGADYRVCVRRLAPLADYLALNVSSPNTPGLRAMQTAAMLRELVDEVRAELAAIGAPTPVLVKIAPDLSEEEVDAVADVARELGLDGLIATNTTVSRRGLSPDRRVEGFEGGGVSGAPLRERSLEVLRRLRARLGDELVLISVGGIESADDAWERILAGATLVQSYTGFVYGGPAWPHRVNRELARRVRAAGAHSVTELVGMGATALRRGRAGTLREGR